MSDSSDPHNRAGLFQKARIAVLVLLTFLLFSTSVKALSGEGVFIDFILNGEQTRIKTTADTVEEFLHTQDVVLSELDQSNHEPSDEIVKNMVIEVELAHNINISIDGEREEYRISRHATRAQIVGIISAERGIKYEFDGIGDAVLSEKSEIIMRSVISRTYTLKEEIPFTTVYQETEELLVGETAEANPGKAGLRETITRVTYIGGVQTSETVVSDTVLDQPVNKVILTGTRVEIVEEPVLAAPEVPVLEFKYSSVFEMTATAYNSSYVCTGKNPGDKGYGITASGMKAEFGVVAVDPKVIPLGTKLYIDGYGFAVAGDTGGAIKGNKIDLYIEDAQEMKTFGRKTVTVYVLEA